MLRRSILKRPRLVTVPVLLAAYHIAFAQDPWPMWQRTATRLGRTTSIGPRTPTIAWRVRIDPTPWWPAELSASATMDAAGRVFVPHWYGVTAVSSHTHEVNWYFPMDEGTSGAPAIFQGKVLFGSADDFFYCVDAATGQEIWSQPAAPHPNYSSAVDSNGIVYYTSQREVMYARRVEDGELLWTASIGNGTYSSPALDETQFVFTGSEDWGDWAAHWTADGQREWGTFVGHGNLGTGPVDLSAGEDGRTYVATRGGYLRALDRLTGEEIWSHPTGETLTGAVAVGHDGTIYVPTACCDRVLIAVSASGDELWRHELGGGVKFAPIIDGEGIIYVCSNEWTGSYYIGRLHAVRPDGTGMWIREMPEWTAASPMLAPDGTLYVVCSDKYLYAFHDPPLANDAGEQKQPIDIRRRPPP
jgi:outer membrane protein assembly factor BamB